MGDLVVSFDDKVLDAHGISMEIGWCVQGVVLLSVCYSMWGSGWSLTVQHYLYDS